MACFNFYRPTDFQDDGCLGAIVIDDLGALHGFSNYQGLNILTVIFSVTVTILNGITI